MPGGEAAVHAAIVARATKASGVIVRVSPADLLGLLERAEAPLVVVARGGFLGRKFHYLASYKGLAFFAQSPEQLVLPRRCETVVAEKIWIPQ